MNGNTSTTAKAERLPDAERLTAQWKAVDWMLVETEVNRLQARIAKATQKKKWNTVKQLQYLLTHSYYAKLLAVRKVTTNKGKKTAGVDKVLWKTPAQKMNAALTLTDKGYKASPLRRVYIDKKGKQSKRPLGIPTMYDRAMQALYALALDPVSEATADNRSFGFRKGRCAQDACEYIFSDLARKVSPAWVLEGDIKGCFDHISHDWLIANIPMDKSILKQFLKAGFVFKGELFPTEDGTPQGGVISPILANMALDGMEEILSDRFNINSRGRYDRNWKRRYKVNLVRYADDFIVTAATKEVAEQAKTVLCDFLKTRGLELSEEKTVITHIEDGFDMLGWTFRKFKGKLIVKPSKKSVKAIIASLSETILRRGKAWKQEILIEKLNQKIRGWANYHQSVCASKTFSHIDNMLYEFLWSWAKRRHPKKRKCWTLTRYWRRKGNRSWVFSTEDGKTLLRTDHIPIVRHTRVRMEANPYLEPEYFTQRHFEHGMERLSGRFKQVWKNQRGCCYHCGLPIDLNDEKKIFFKLPRDKGGKDEVPNMAYVHKHCQSIFLERRSKE
ncbi:MAG: group II intron reverse transcriptase/maturase [Oscillospiraceae bacterium]|nr:group II intron reverse transcriptase/maturase [Oscillospiraceae bacterium]